MSGLKGGLLLCGLILSIALTAAWGSFVSYELFRFFEFVF